MTVSCGLCQMYEWRQDQRPGECWTGSGLASAERDVALAVLPAEATHTVKFLCRGLLDSQPGCTAAEQRRVWWTVSTNQLSCSSTKLQGSQPVYSLSGWKSTGHAGPTTPNKTLLAFKRVFMPPLVVSLSSFFFFLFFLPSFFLSFCLSSNQTKWQICYNFSINTLFKNVKYLWGREEEITFCVRKARLAPFWGSSEDVISVIFHQCEDYWKRCGRKIVTTHDT